MGNGNGGDRDPRINLQCEDGCQQASDPKPGDGRDPASEKRSYDNEDIWGHNVKLLRFPALCAVLGAALSVAACTGRNEAPAEATNPPATTDSVPQSLAMGGAKSVTRFFVTSTGLGRGGDLGGLGGADAHCQALAKGEGAGDHTWRAYLSTAATATQPAVNARDRIGPGPWYNSGGERIAMSIEQLHSAGSVINKETAVTERLDTVNGVGDAPNRHDILTGSRPDRTAFPGNEDLTCGSWTSSSAGRAQVGHHDRMGQGDGASSWNSAHPSRGCSEQDLQSTGGAGLFYCFAID